MYFKKIALIQYDCSDANICKWKIRIPLWTIEMRSQSTLGEAGDHAGLGA